MSERDAFLAAILADPADTACRLVFADWLDEHGEPERAAFIRLHCEAALSADDPRRFAWRGRVADALVAHRSRWELELPQSEGTGWSRHRESPAPGGDVG